MKHFHQNLKRVLAIAILAAGVSSMSAQRMVVVPSPGNLSDVIFGDTTATGARVDDNTMYVLKRNGFYAVSKTLQLNVPLQLKTEEGAGNRAYIYPKPNSTGGYPTLIQANSDVYLESVHITNSNGAGAQPKWGGFRAQGENSKIVLKDCFVEWDKASAIQIRANGVSVSFKNCRIGKMGDYKLRNGNGRIVDAREFDMHKIEMINNTFYYLSDRIIRNMQGGIIDSLIFDHNTGNNIQGFHGLFHLGKIKYAQITNNLIMNPKYMGSHTNVSEQTGPAPDNQKHYLVTADTIFNETKFVIHHNNFAYTQEVLDFFASLDTVSKPEVLAPIVANAMGAAAANASFEEVVTFTKMPALPKDFMYGLFTAPKVTPTPDNFPDDIGIAAIEATYSASSTSATAAEYGLPLGDLTWWPLVNGVNKTKLDNNLVSVYPNPANNELNVNLNLNSVQMQHYRYLTLQVKWLNLKY